MLRSALSFVLVAVTLSLMNVAAWAANDLGVTALTSPVTGVSLSAQETVTVQIFNFGDALPAGTSFNVSYSVNAGPPATELVTLGSTFQAHTVLRYSFTTAVNLTTPGTYEIDAGASLPGDISPANNATEATVRCIAPSVGGAVSSPVIGSVVAGANSGVLTLSGHTGAVVRWEISMDAGLTWLYVNNLTTAQSFSNLKETTSYRAVVANEEAPPAYSTEATITVIPAPPILPGSQILFPANNATLPRKAQFVSWGTCEAGQPFAYLTLTRTSGGVTRTLFTNKKVASGANYNWALNLKPFLAIAGTYGLKIASQPSAMPAQTIQFTVQ